MKTCIPIFKVTAMPFYMDWDVNPILWEMFHVSYQEYPLITVAPGPGDLLIHAILESKAQLRQEVCT